MTIEEAISHHRIECVFCAVTPRLCPVLPELTAEREQQRKIKAQQYTDDMIARRQESNPEWTRGSFQSPFFEERSPSY